MSQTARSTRHAGIDRDDIVDAALRLVEDEGADALTMRRLAAELGVTATTIYWHVGNRDDVVVALVERHGQQLAARPVTGDDPADRIIAAAMAVWDSALAHPEVMRLAHASGATSALEMHLEIALARELTAAGVTGEEARDALRSLLICVGGFLVLALRPADAVPTELAGTALWAAVDDDGVAPATARALTRPIDREALLRRTLGSIVADYL